MHRAAAETLALKGLGHLAADGEGLLRFLRLSGLEIADLRGRAADPELLGAVLDFLQSEEKLCESFLTAEQIQPQELHAARRALPGVAPES